MSLTSAGLSLPSNVCLVKCISTPARLGSQQMWHLTLIPGDWPPPAARGSLRCRIGSGGAGRAAAGGAVVLAEDDILGKGYGIISGLFFFCHCYPEKHPVGLRRCCIPEVFRVWVCGGVTL